MWQLFDRILKIIEKHLGWRHALELLTLLVGVGITLILVWRTTTWKEVLAVTIWLVLALWYIWIAYRKHIPRRVMVSLLVLAVLSFVGWAVALGWYLKSPERQIAALVQLGQKFERQGAFLEAAKKYEQCLAIAKDSGNRSAEPGCLCKLGQTQALLGEADSSRSNLNSCMLLSIELEMPEKQGQALGALGDLESQQGKHDLARQHYGEARGLFQQVGNRLGEAGVLLVLGELERLQGNHDLARQHYGEARGLFQQVGDRLGEANVLLGLGDLESQQGNHHLARQHYTEARGLFQQEGHPLGEANADFAEGQLLAKLGQKHEAIEMLNRAYLNYARLGMNDWADRAKQEIKKLEGNTRKDQ